MKKVKKQIIEIRPQVVFEVSNRPVSSQEADPTTSLGATTFTGILTATAAHMANQAHLQQ